MKRPVHRLTAQRRIFEMSKALKQELEKELIELENKRNTTGYETGKVTRDTLLGK